MGMDNLMLSCIRALAENRIQDAKQAAIACCVNDTTKKNAGKTGYYKKLLENGTTTLFELPANLKGLILMQDVSDFNESRYYLGAKQRALYSQIKMGADVTTKMLAYGIPYTNSTLLHGVPGTGKTEFARYVAFLGKTAKNLNQVFDYCKGEKCVLMLDEIDCIGLARGHDHGVDGELGRTTIALMQSLDSLVDGQVVIAATNRRDRLDPALLRRFQRQEEFLPFEYEERKAMIQAYMQSVNPDFLTDEILGYANDAHTQSDITKYLIEQIVSRVTAEVTGAV